MTAPGTSESIYAGAASGPRMAGASGAMLVTGLLLAALWLGLATRAEHPAEAALRVFDVLPPAPPPPETIERPSKAHAGDAAPPHRTARPVPIEAPTPIIRMPLPPVVAAPIAAAGPDAEAGAAIDGPGTGAASAGRGFGAGGPGSGTGSGIVAPARHVAGTITNKDYPKQAREAGQGGTVIVTLAIDAAGAVTGCTVARSSGVPALDEATCRLARARFRYTPARDAAGQAVPDLAGWKQVWWIEGKR